MIDILNQLDQAEKVANQSKWEASDSGYSDGVGFLSAKDNSTLMAGGIYRENYDMAFKKKEDAELIALMRNNIKSLIAVARAAEILCKPTSPDCETFLFQQPNSKTTGTFSLLTGDSILEPLKKALAKLKGEV